MRHPVAMLCFAFGFSRSRISILDLARVSKKDCSRKEIVGSAGKSPKTSFSVFAASMSVFLRQWQ